MLNYDLTLLFKQFILMCVVWVVVMGQSYSLALFLPIHNKKQHSVCVYSAKVAETTRHHAKTISEYVLAQ